MAKYVKLCQTRFLHLLIHNKNHLILLRLIIKCQIYWPLVLNWMFFFFKKKIYPKNNILNNNVFVTNGSRTMVESNGYIFLKYILFLQVFKGYLY